MGRLGYCVPCGERRRDVDAVVVIDGDPMCAGCARGAAPVTPAPDEVPEPKAIRAELCARGCGNPRHRGRCAGRPVGGVDAEEPKVCSRGCGRPPHRGFCKGAVGGFDAVIPKAVIPKAPQPAQPILPVGKWPIESAKAEAFRLRHLKSAMAISKIIGWAQPTISKWLREADAVSGESVPPPLTRLPEPVRVELVDSPPAVEPVRLVLEEGVMRPMQATVSASATDVLSVKVKAGSMDRLIVEEVAIDAVPKVAVLRRPLGRAGELWVRFQALAPGLSLKVKCRDATHAGTTHRDLVAKAKKFGLAVGSRRVGNDYYCWRINGSV